MSVTTGTKWYRIAQFCYDEDSEELVGIFFSSAVQMELGFELSPEAMPAALLVFQTEDPEEYRRFMRAHPVQRKPGSRLVRLKPFITDSGRNYWLRTLQDVEKQYPYAQLVPYEE